MVTHEALAAAGWHWPEALLKTLTDYEREFVAFEFLAPRSLDYYLQRIDYLGFSELGRVLDAGCGEGWLASALAERSVRKS